MQNKCSLFTNCVQLIHHLHSKNYTCIPFFLLSVTAIFTGSLLMSAKYKNLLINFKVITKKWASKHVRCSKINKDHWP